MGCRQHTSNPDRSADSGQRKSRGKSSRNEAGLGSVCGRTASSDKWTFMRTGGTDGEAREKVGREEDQ